MRIDKEHRRSETPPLPWFKRQKTLDEQRASAKAAQEASDLEAFFLEMLPDYTTHGANISWLNHEHNEIGQIQVPSFGDDDDGNLDVFMPGVSHGLRDERNVSDGSARFLPQQMWTDPGTRSEVRHTGPSRHVFLASI